MPPVWRAGDFRPYLPISSRVKALSINYQYQLLSIYRIKTIWDWARDNEWIRIFYILSNTFHPTEGRRPSFARAAPPETAKELYDRFIGLLRKQGIHVATGRFQEMMAVFLVNDGPVTLILDSHKNF